MAFTINGTNGLTFPDSTTQTTRAVSRSGDTMTGQLNINTYPNRQLNVNAWLELSGGAGGQAFVGSNIYNHYDGTTVSWKSAQSHASIGGGGLAANYPAWNSHSLICLDQTTSTANATVTPISALVWDQKGRVTMPQQPFIRCIGKSTGGSFNPTTTATKYNWNAPAEAINSAWNSSTNTWTCPIYGRYMVACNVLAIPYNSGQTPVGGGINMFIRKNGVNIGSSRAILRSDTESNLSCVVYTVGNVGDTLEVFFSADANNASAIWQDYTTLTMALVG